MRNLFKLTCLAASLAGLALVPTAWAADSSTQEAPPPKLQKLDESDTPITIRPPSSGTKIIERRGSGNELKEVEVKSGKSTYTLRPRQIPGNTSADQLVIPEWKLKEFGKEPAEEKSAPQQLEPAKKKPVSGDK